MREKLKTLPLSELRALAKSQNVPRSYALKKDELIDALIALLEAQNAAAEHAVQAEAPIVREEVAAAAEVPAKPEAEPETEPEKDAEKEAEKEVEKDDKEALKSGIIGRGILDIQPDGYGFLRDKTYHLSKDDIYISASQIKRFGLKNGDEVSGHIRDSKERSNNNLTLINTINGIDVAVYKRKTTFEDLTPVFPHERLRLEYPGCETSVRIIDLLSPIGKGQRGMIVAQPKVGKTTLLKQICRSLLKKHPELHIMILLIDERPEEVTDMEDSFSESNNVEIIYSTFDESPSHHVEVSKLVIERAKRLVEEKRDVVLLLDSITRLTRACNLTCTASGKTLSGGLDPAALEVPKKFFGAARAMREGGSLTILATALQETGSRLDDMVYEEFKGTGNMELVLSRKLSERRIFPAIDILRSSTRRDDLLLTPDEQNAVRFIRRATTTGSRPEAAMESFLDMFASTKDNYEFIARVQHLVL